MFTIKVSREFLSAYGSSSLLGLLLDQGFDIATMKEIRVEFEQTSMDYRRKHNGPDEIIIPEFVPMCLSMDLLTLMNRGIKIEIGEYNKTLMPFKLPAISKSKEANKATGEVD